MLNIWKFSYSVKNIFFLLVEFGTPSINLIYWCSIGKKGNPSTFKDILKAVKHVFFIFHPFSYLVIGMTDFFWETWLTDQSCSSSMLYFCWHRKYVSKYSFVFKPSILNILHYMGRCTAIGIKKGAFYMEVCKIYLLFVKMLQVNRNMLHHPTPIFFWHAYVCMYVCVYVHECLRANACVLASMCMRSCV